MAEPDVHAAHDTQHPYSTLTPDLVLDALQSLGLVGDGRLLALNSYENRVYQVYLDDGRVVVAKFYRPARWTDAQIAEEHALVQELYAAEVPVVPAMDIDGATLHSHAGFRFAVYPRAGGRAPELEGRYASDKREWLGRFIARIHSVGAHHLFEHRPALDSHTHGEEPRSYLLEHGFIPQDLLPAWQSVTADALAAVRTAFACLGELQSLRLHGDCHLGNVLWLDYGANEGPHFVDFDDARNGPAMQDVWMLLSGDRRSMTQQLSDVLTGYEEFREFDRRELALLEPLRTLRMIHYSAWLARRWSDPAFPSAFPWFNTQRYWQDQVLALREQVAAMQEPVLDV
jgi:Ser/Thr protein kinase RdoA (MazF antagonist)